MILYISGIGAVYITANFVVISSASKSDQGAAAAVFNVALQIGGSILGLAVPTAVAEGIEKAHNNADLPRGELSSTGYRSVYYSCVILSGIGLFLSVFAIEVPESMRGSIWKKKVGASGATEISSSYELQST
jgi:MFS family permease